MITRHQFALHLSRDSTVIPNYLSLKCGYACAAGAVAVEDLVTGRVITLAHQSAAQRELVAKQLLMASTAPGEAAVVRRGKGARRPPAAAHAGKVVYRHLQDGDVMLTNRQPTLHKPGALRCVQWLSAAAAAPDRALRLCFCFKAVVHRHLQDGDVMLTIRQPTLRKPGARCCRS